MEKRKRVFIDSKIYDSIESMAEGAGIPFQDLVDEILDKAMKLTMVAVVDLK